MTVVVAADPLAEPQLAHPGWLAPSVPGRPAPSTQSLPPPARDQEFWWAPERSPTGPLSLLLSSADGSVRVLRNGIEIGFAQVRFEGAPPAGTQVLQLRGGALPEESRFVPGKPRLDWTRLRLEAAGPDAEIDELYRRVHLSAEFARLVYDSLEPGTTVVVTDLPASTETSNEPILDAEAGEPRGR